MPVTVSQNGSSNGSHAAVARRPATVKPPRVAVGPEENAQQVRAALARETAAR